MKKIIITFLMILGIATVHAQELKFVLPIGHTQRITSIHLSPDDKKIVTTSDDHTAKLWDAFSGLLLASLKGHNDGVSDAAFSPDGKKILTISWDTTVKIWDAISGSLIATLKGHTEDIKSAQFFSGDKRVLTVSEDSTAKIWDAVSGSLITTFRHTGRINSVEFSPGNKKVLIASDDHTARIWDTSTGKSLITMEHTESISDAKFSPDYKLVLTTSGTRLVRTWNANTGKLLADLKLVKPYYSGLDAAFSADSKKIILDSYDSISTCDAFSGKLLSIVSMNHQDPWSILDSLKIVMPDGTFKDLETDCGIVLKKYSPDGKELLTACDNGKTQLWNVNSKSLIASLTGLARYVKSAQFSADSKRLIIHSGLTEVNIWDVTTGKMLGDLSGRNAGLRYAGFSPDGKKIITATENENTIKIWEVATGQLLVNFKDVYKRASWGEGYPYYQSFLFSPDSKKVAMISPYPLSKAEIWNAVSGERITILDINWATDNGVTELIFSRDSKKLKTIQDGITRIWDTETGLPASQEQEEWIVFDGYYLPSLKSAAIKDNLVEIQDKTTGTTTILRGHTDIIRCARLSPDSKKVVTASRDNTCKLWNAETGELLYTFFAVDSTDYLVTDNYGRYDGSEGARKLLYYTCGTEVIGLDQVKDQLWVPDLAERVMNGDSINAPKLSDLHICGLIPEVEIEDTANNKYRFKITPRRGGLGETILYVNGNDTKHYQPNELNKTKDGYELAVNKDELKVYFVSGQENPVTVKCYIASNDILSRGATVIVKPQGKNVVVPNLYAVMVGVSDYKGDGLDLKYAAKDAGDLSRVVESAAKKWLDKDGKEHVFMYNLTTDKNHYLLPEKNAIIKTLKEIGEKTTANDILLVFFAGHGVIQGGEKKQFYFLTADASEATATGTAIKDVGISSSELIDWLQPSHIKAQKRILILDACNSGQAINDIANNNNLAVRNTDDAEQIKSIDKLNERSGLFILAASASDQSAYEMSRYSQGILTYSLLKAIKEDPSILEDNKYLNLGRWFNAAENTVNELVKETGARQQPQIVSNTNFNIGIVDADVIAAIVLPNEKTLFTSSNLQNNDENIAADDLSLSKLIDNNLSSISARDTNRNITFLSATHTPDAYSINGRYDVKENKIAVKINIRQNNETKYRFELSGAKNNLDELANEIVKEVLKKTGNKK